MSIIPAGISGETPQYQISRSLRFNSADSAYLSRTPSVAGNRTTWTWSAWIKISALTTSYGRQWIFTQGINNSSFTEFDIFDGGGILFQHYTQATGTVVVIYSADRFRDISSWYHFVIRYNSSSSVASDRVKIYVNNRELNTTGSTYPSQNFESFVNSTNQITLGSLAGFNQGYFNGYMTEINFIDGQALTPSSFGETDPTTGVWRPKKYTGTYGTNGFYLNFKDNSAATATTLGKDYSGNNNNWTPNNFSVTAGVGNDSMVDTPTPYGTDTGVGGQVRGNYCTWNALELTGGATLTNGNLDFNAPNSGTDYPIKGTIASPSGKWYYEVTITSASTTNPTCRVGVCTASTKLERGSPGTEATSWGMYLGNGQTYHNNIISNYGTAFVINDICMVAYDIDNGKIWWGKNGTWFNSGNPSLGTNPAFTNLSGLIIPTIGDGVNTATSTNVTNFGQRPFAYTAPSGFKALCTANLPEPTIKKGAEQFNTVTYTGTGSTRSVTGVGFGPGLTWIKSRSASTDHALYDTVRGATKQLESNTATQETTESTGLTSFDSNGFTLGSLAQLNTSGATYVGWNWKGGGTAVTNTQGSITSQVSANPTAGFSIVTWAGVPVNSNSSTIGHGLGISPKFIIIRNRDMVDISYAYHTYGGNNNLFRLGTINAMTSSTSIWGTSNPTSTVFGIRNDAFTNATTQNLVAYCFAEIPGYSAFGSYTGNGSTDGPFVYTGFRPRFVLLKVTNTTGNWTILDTLREGYNVDNDPLYPNLNNAEDTTDLLDILSNGFKLRTTDASVNGNTNTYIYAAFAENPFKYSLAR